MADIPPASRPPADPRVQRPPADATGQIGAYERPARWQTVAAVVLGVVLIALPLYLWRRPRSVAEPVDRDDAAVVPAALVVDAAPAEEEAGAHGLQLGDPRVLECKDPGAVHTPPERMRPRRRVREGLCPGHRGCARLRAEPAVGGTITYVADLAFARRKGPVTVSRPAGRALDQDGQGHRSLPGRRPARHLGHSARRADACSCALPDRPDRDLPGLEVSPCARRGGVACGRHPGGAQ